MTSTIPSHPAAPSRLHPLIAMAAMALTLLSAAGIAALTGLLPGERGQATVAAAVEPQPAARHVAAPVPVLCLDCGVVESLRSIEQEGEGSGLGAIAGGVVGGVLGNQVGKGGGKTLATVLGIAGGAYAGHQIEKAQKKTLRYEIAVRMADGSLRTVIQETRPVWREGERVRFDNGVLVPDYARPV